MKNMITLLVIIGISCILLAAVIRLSLPVATPEKAPADRATRIRRVVLITNDVKENHYYLDIYLSKPGWSVIRAVESEEEARRVKKIHDWVNYETKQVSEEILP